MLTSGTFLGGMMHCGTSHAEGGRAGDAASHGITESLRAIGFETGRMKTGTPARLDARTIDFESLEPQYGDENPAKFSFSPDTQPVKHQLPCFLVYTTAEVHDLLRTGFDRSPLFNGTIKCLIIGSGPAGYTAAIYTSRANLRPVLYEGIEPGGQLTTTTDVENFPGYPDGVSGQQMMADMRRQAERFGTEIRTGTATRVDLASRPFHVVIDGTTQIKAETLIIATGASAKYLGLPSETKFRGMGVSACATCDGFFYRKKDVAVVGGGDTACEEATYLASICRKVYMIVRKPHLRASKAMQERVFNTTNIEVMFNHNTAEVLGDE